MEFSLFNLTTRPHDALSHGEVFAQMRAMVAIAEAAAFDIAWFAEHHMSNYCISPPPLTTTAHMAGHTRKIKLGPAVVVLPLYEPLRLIEAMLRAPSFENEPSVDKVLDDALIGSADVVAEKIVNDAEQYGMTHLSVFMQFADMPYDATLKSLERFGDEVMPAVKKTTAQ